MMLSEAAFRSRTFETLLAAALRLKLVDQWETTSSKVIIVQGPVRYHVAAEDAPAFLKSLIDLHEVEQIAMEPQR